MLTREPVAVDRSNGLCSRFVRGRAPLACLARCVPVSHFSPPACSRWRCRPPPRPPSRSGSPRTKPSMFSDPLFQGVGFKQARVIVGYDVALDPTSAEFGRLADYLAAAQAAGVEPLVSFQHTRGDTSRCDQKKYFGKGICKLPSQKAYESAMKAFFAAFPTVKVVSPWNEANHFTQPTSRSPAVGGEVHQHGGEALPDLQDRRRRHPRPGRRSRRQEPEVQGDRQVHQDLPQVAEGPAQRSAASTTTPTSTASARPAPPRS